MDEKAICELLGASVRRLRRWNRWTQEALAEKTEVSPNFLSNIENGKVWVSPKTLAKMAEVFKVEPYELFMAKIEGEPETASLISRYNTAVKALLDTALDDLEKRFRGEMSIL